MAPSQDGGQLKNPRLKNQAVVLSDSTLDSLPLLLIYFREIS